MIRNGFVRDQEADWYSLRQIDKFSVFVAGIPVDDKTPNIGVEATWTNAEGEEVSILIEDGFESQKEARQFLDRMMKGDL